MAPAVDRLSTLPRDFYLAYKLPKYMTIRFIENNTLTPESPCEIVDPLCKSLHISCESAILIRCN